MNKLIDRREMLKLLSSTPAGLLMPCGVDGLTDNQESSLPKNILIIVFDAFSAYNIPFYGYVRDTTPESSKLLDRAIVYHNHYASGAYTTPGTASLLTGVLPWTHRANKIHNEVIAPYNRQNLFSAFEANNYYTTSYTHNPLVGTLLHQFRKNIDLNTPRRDLMVRTGWGTGLLENDSDLIDILQRNLVLGNDGFFDSLLFGKQLNQLYFRKREIVEKQYKKVFPGGLPRSGLDDFFTLETANDWLRSNLITLPQPFLGYYHFIPPHHPYKTRIEFQDYFDPNQEFIEKPLHILGKFRSQSNVNDKRLHYDRSILYVDYEFNRLFTDLDQSGLLDNTWVILTSDHGEIFERGIVGHSSDTLYEPGIKIPLVIFEPGRTKRIDVFQRTSAVDILPTLMHISGLEMPDWVEGCVMSPFDTDMPKRNIYAVMAQNIPRAAPLTSATAMMIRDKYKLIYYWGYPELPEQNMFELYDIEEDPEELTNLYAPNTPLSKNLKEELLDKIDEVEKPYIA